MTDQEWEPPWPSHGPHSSSRTSWSQDMEAAAASTEGGGKESTGTDSWLPSAGYTGTPGKCCRSCRAVPRTMSALEARVWRQISCAGRSPVQ